MHMCTQAFKVPRLRPDVFLDHSSFHILRKLSHLSPELTVPARLARQFALGTSVSPTWDLELQMGHHDHLEFRWELGGLGS